MKIPFDAGRRALLKLARVAATSALIAPYALEAASGRWIRPGGSVPPGSWWAGGGPRLAPSAARIVAQDEPGQSLTLYGRIIGRNGRPLPGVTVYVYQTDARGLYNPEGRYGVAHRIRGWACTDREGRYEFSTIKPGYYPDRSTPAHIHMTVASPSMPEWWLPEVRFEGDPLIPKGDYEVSRRDGRFGNICALRTGPDDVLTCLRDVQI